MRKSFFQLLMLFVKQRFLLLLLLTQYYQLAALIPMNSAASSSDLFRPSPEIFDLLTKDTDEDIFTWSVPQKLSKRDKLFISVEDKFTQLAFVTVIDGKHVLELLYKDLSELRTKNKTLVYNITFIYYFNRIAEHFEKLETTYPEEPVLEVAQAHNSNDIRMPLRKIYLFKIFYDYLRFYENTSPEQLNTEERLIRFLFEKHGLKSLSNEFLKRFSIFSQKLYAQYQAYIEALTQLEKQNEADVVYFYEKFTQEYDELKKFDIFYKFHFYNKELIDIHSKMTGHDSLKMKQL